MLSQAQLGAFVRDGFVAVRGAVPGAVLEACQEEIWSALGDHGVLRDDPSTWRDPVVRIPCPESEAFASWPHAGRNPRIVAQPGVALHDAFPLVPPLSPVELGMLAG
jgi:hypothetical protein